MSFEPEPRVEVRTTTMNTACGPLGFGAPATIAFDRVTYVDRCGGLDNVASVLRALLPNLGVRAVTQLARKCVVDVPVVQRLGYLLELLGHVHLTGSVHDVIRGVPLVAGTDTKRSSLDDRWGLYINHVVGVDA